MLLFTKGSTFCSKVVIHSLLLFQAEPLIRTAKNDVINLGLDLKTGSFANAKDLTETVSPKVVEKPTPATPAVDENLATEIDKQLAAISESYDSMVNADTISIFYHSNVQ